MSLWDVIYPVGCIGCNSWGKYLCENCLKQIRVSHIFSRDGSSLFEYRGVMRVVVTQLKYRFIKDMKKELGELIKKGLKQKLKDRVEWRLKDFLKLKPKVQPVPLHKARLNWRGFNQAEIIAKIVAEELRLELADSLVRVKKTKPQMSLLREQRLKNMVGVFKIKPGILPKAGLVVDDVWTSGATIREVMKMLKEKGCQVYGLTLAR